MANKKVQKSHLFWTLCRHLLLYHDFHGSQSSV